MPTHTGVRARPDLVASSVSNPPGVVVRGGDFPVRDHIVVVKKPPPPV